MYLLRPARVVRLLKHAPAELLDRVDRGVVLDFAEGCLSIGHDLRLILQLDHVLEHGLSLLSGPGCRPVAAGSRRPGRPARGGRRWRPTSGRRARPCRRRANGAWPLRAPGTGCCRAGRSTGRPGASWARAEPPPRAPYRYEEPRGGQRSVVILRSTFMTPITRRNRSGSARPRGFGRTISGRGPTCNLTSNARSGHNRISGAQPRSGQYDTLNLLIFLHFRSRPQSPTPSPHHATRLSWDRSGCPRAARRPRCGADTP